jgi:hypothetical protein
LGGRIASCWGTDADIRLLQQRPKLLRRR